MASRLLAKLPAAMLIAAGLLAAVSSVSQHSAPAPDPVRAAIEAPFIDVGIGSVDKSLAFWQQRVDDNPADYLSKTRLATTLMTKAKQTGDLSLYPRAEQILQQALALNPTDDASLLALAGARSANHDFTTARDLAQRVLDRNPASQAALVTIADSDFELGVYDVAARELANLVATLPDGVGIESRQAKRAAIEGRTGDAIRYAADAVLAASDLDLSRSDAAFYRFQLGHFLAQAGRLDDALAVLDAGLRIDPEHLPSLEAKAQVLTSLGRLDEAAHLYEQLLARTPAADLYGTLARLYRALGRTAEATTLVAKGLEVGHTQLSLYPAERRHLAAFFAEFEPTTALVAATADFQTRKDIGAYDTLAWAYYRNGQYDDADRYVEGALAQGTQDATLLYHAGMIEAAVGHHDRAATLLRDALAINSHFDLTHAQEAATELRALGG